MRLAISRDWTGEPPGELTTMATAGAALTAKARFSSGATDAMLSRPGRGSDAMTPCSRTTGMTGPPPPKSRFNQLAMPTPGNPVP